MIMHTQRFRLFSFPDIDRVSTVAILKRFSSGQRWHLIRDISGGYQAQQQKHIDSNPNCNFVAKLTQNHTGCCIAPCLPRLENTTKKLSSILMSLIAFWRNFLCVSLIHIPICYSSYNFVTPSLFLLQRHFNLRSQRNWSKIQSIGVQMAHVFIRKALVHVTLLLQSFWI